MPEDVTPHLQLPLPSATASSQRQDIARIREALERLDAAVDEAEAMAMLFGE